MTSVPVELLFAEGVTAARPAPTGNRITTTPGTCPECGTALAADAVLCVECGFDRRTGKRQKTKKRRLKRKFDRSLPLAGRVAVCMAALLLPALYMALERTFLWFLLPPSLFIAAAFATPYGFRYRITAHRDRHGDLWLTKEHWACLLPLGNWTVNLRGYTEAWTDYSEYVNRNQRHERHILEISGPETPTRRIYDGPNGDFMRDLADILQYDAGLQVRRK